MALVWVATSSIKFNNIRAFNAGNIVPDSVVTRFDLDDKGLVERVERDTASGPSYGVNPVTQLELDALVTGNGRLSDASLRAASVAAVEDAETVAPAGAWDFVQAPTIAGEPIGTGGGGTVTPDATSTVKGKLQLAGDLGGTATAPTVPGLASKVNSSTYTAGIAEAKARANHTGTQTAATISDFTEAVQDAVGALLGAGSNVIVNYDDVANALTISSTGAGGTGLDAEQVRDAIGVALVGIGPIAVTVNDGADTITITTTATANSTDAQLRDRSTHTGTQAATTITGLATVATSGAYGDLTGRPTIPAAPPDASTTVKGVVELATTTETTAGTDSTRAVTPAGLKAVVDGLPSGGSGSGLPSTVVPRTTAYTAAAGDFVLADAATAGFTVTLPAAPATGALVTVKKTDATANVVTVVGSGGATIDGDPNATIVTDNAGAVFQWDGDEWLITAVTSAAGPKGDTGATGPTGATGATGAAGQGVPTGGTTGQILAKTSNTDYATGWIAAPSGGGGSLTVQDEGSALTARATINFVGAGVTATDDAANSRTVVTIPGGGGSSAVYGMGRPGFYFTTPGQIATQTMDVGVMRATPIFLGQATPIDRIGVNITGAASTGGGIRIGVYADSGNMSPGARLFDAGTIDATTTGAKELTVAQTLPAGFCWLVAVAQVAQSIIGANSNVPYVMSHSIAGILENQIPGFASTASSTTGALPTPFGTFNGQVTTPRIVCRAA